MLDHKLMMMNKAMRNFCNLNNKKPSVIKKKREKTHTAQMNNKKMMMMIRNNYHHHHISPIVNLMFKTINFIRKLKKMRTFILI